MNIASLDSLRALALLSILASGCGSDEGISSVPPLERDSAPPPELKPDAAAPKPDAAVTLDAGDDAAALDAADDGALADGAADATADASPDLEVDARTCGGMGQAPCAGARCADGLCLSDTNKCIGPGMACGQMSGNCNANGSCGNGAQACGGEGQGCCGIGAPPEGAFCSRPGTVCLGNGANRTCRACGDQGQPCCGEPGTCASGTCMGNNNNRMCQ